MLVLERLMLARGALLLFNLSTSVNTLALAHLLLAGPRCRSSIRNGVAARTTLGALPRWVGLLVGFAYVVGANHRCGVAGRNPVRFGPDGRCLTSRRWLNSDQDRLARTDGGSGLEVELLDGLRVRDGRPDLPLWQFRSIRSGAGHRPCRPGGGDRCDVDRSGLCDSCAGQL